MPSRPDLITPGMLGVDTAATRAHFDSHLAGLFDTAPNFMMGASRPDKSPNNSAKLTYRYAGQLIGNCVGEAGAHAGEYLANDDDGKAGLGQALSALWVYQIGRALCAKQGIRLGGEGCIVSVAAQAVQAQGYATQATYPVTPAAYQNYSDRRPLPAAAVAEAAGHPLIKFLRCDTFDKMLDYLGQGFPAWVGKPITAGMLSTDDTGYYRIRGPIKGGHSTLLTDYDMTAGTIEEFNSWANVLWGEKSADPSLPKECQGHNNLGHTDLDAMAKVFNSGDIADGTCEVIIPMTMTTWRAKIESFGTVLD